MKRSIVVMLVVALVAAAFVAPAEARRRKKKKKKPPVCQPYAPGEMGAEAETLVVTDAATEEEPVVFEFNLGADFDEGLQGDAPASVVNVQVDSAAPTTGLYATFEFPPRRDYDLYAYWPTGEEAASSHGFNQLVEAKTSPPLPFDVSNTNGNHAGESTDHSENLIGVTTPDCGGYTMQMLNYFGEGGDFELKLWLGAPENEPLAPGEGG
jgi:hypothetical protein